MDGKHDDYTTMEQNPAVVVTNFRTREAQKDKHVSVSMVEKLRNVTRHEAKVCSYGKAF